MKQLKQAGTLLIIGIIVILVREYEWRQKISTPPQIQGEARLVRVVDGDTFVVDVEGKEHKARIIGIDTPESVKPNTPVECFAREATEKLQELLSRSEMLRISSDPTQDTRDNYGRLLIHVFVDNLNIGEEMIAGGYAYEYTYREPYLYQHEYKNAERTARVNERGLWSPDTCNGKT